MDQHGLLATALYVQDVALDNIDCYGLDTEEKWSNWLAEHGAKLEDDADQLFVGDSDLPPALLDD